MRTQEKVEKSSLTVRYLEDFSLEAWWCEDSSFVQHVYKSKAVFILRQIMKYRNNTEVIKKYKHLDIAKT